MKVFMKVFLTVAIVCFLFLVGFGWRDFQSGKLPSKETFGKLNAFILAPKKISDRDLFIRSFRKIESDYYKKVDFENLRSASFEGLASALGDPHTSYLDKKFASQFKLETEGRFVGVGARLSADPLGAKIANVFETGPAAKAGIKNNDIVTAVDGATMAGKAIDAIVRKIRGVEGTIVKLTVIREGASKPLTFAIKRAQITTPTVEAKVIPNTSYGYLSISSFSEVTVSQFDDGLDKLEKANIKGLIIDLRSNPGGLLDTARDLLSRFVANKVVVTVRERGSKSQEVKTADDLVRSFDYPIVVLINEDSASAAEIMAGALRDYRLVTLVGEHTYGKASVQTTIPFIDSSMLKVTIGRYYLPNGAFIGRKMDEDGHYLGGGIEPEVTCDLNYDLMPTFGEIKTDTQLQKAVEVLNSKQDR